MGRCWILEVMKDFVVLGLCVRGLSFGARNQEFGLSDLWIRGWVFSQTPSMFLF